MNCVKTLIRPNIEKLTAYVSARSQFTGDEKILMDANENPYGDKLVTRYPDPLQLAFVEKFSQFLGIKAENMLLGNGSDELLDLLIRIFCEPQKDNILVLKPSFSMYGVLANINNVGILEMPLDSAFDLDLKYFNNIISESKNLKIVFLCSPNSPTGNLLSIEKVEEILRNFDGIVVIDEAYVQFSKQKSWIHRLGEFPNLVVFQTFSKYWGMAGARLGAVYANSEIIDCFKKIKPPYNVNNLTIEEAFKNLENYEGIEKVAQIIIFEREKISKKLSSFRFVTKVYASVANFLFLEVLDARKLYEFLFTHDIVIRKYSNIKNHVRISIGTEAENKKLIEVLNKFN